MREDIRFIFQRLKKNKDLECIFCVCYTLLNDELIFKMFFLIGGSVIITYNACRVNFEVLYNSLYLLDIDIVYVFVQCQR